VVHFKAPTFARAELTSLKVRRRPVRSGLMDAFIVDSARRSQRLWCCIAQLSISGDLPGRPQTAMTLFVATDIRVCCAVAYGQLTAVVAVDK
jgi:hypothetical protein